MDQQFETYADATYSEIAVRDLLQLETILVGGGDVPTNQY